MVAREPAHLARMVKACPRPGCGSSNVKWCYYNNKQQSQPLYRCLGCKELFTFGGKIRPSKEKLQAALREVHVGGASLKEKGPRIKITPAMSSSSHVRPVKELRLMMESRLKRNKIRKCPNYLSVQSASSISKKMRGGVILLRLATGSVISLPDSSSNEKCQVDADANMNVSPTELQEMFVGFQKVVREFVEMFVGPERLALEPESEVVDDSGAASGAGALNDQLEAVEDGGPGFSWTCSLQQLQSPTIRCGGSSARSELLDSELESS